MALEGGVTLGVDPTYVVGEMEEEESQDEWQTRDEAETHNSQQVQPVRSGGPVALSLPQTDAELRSQPHGFCDEQETDSQSTSPVPLRWSSRQRRPR